jgi:thymidylate synthase
MNKLDKDYQALLQDILDNGVTKKDRTGTGTISVFGRQIRHKMSDGFPLLTTKKMYFKGIVTELLWFLRGDTNIKYLVDNNCHIWDGDAYKRYWFNWKPMLEDCGEDLTPHTQKEFINRIKTDDEFAQKWGELGPVYGQQWRSWRKFNYDSYDEERGITTDIECSITYVDQIANLINDLKTNPDSRRLMVSAWNVGELDSMVLPPCHYGFQVYTRELSLEERRKLANHDSEFISPITVESWDRANIPTRAISLMWNQRSVDTFLGLPFNITSYGLLLEIVAKVVNMVPDELIGNLGDTHLYLNHIEQAKEQMSRELSLEERRSLVSQEMFNQIYTGGGPDLLNHSECDQWNIPRFEDRKPYPLPKLVINSGNENWHLLDIDEIINSLDPDITFKLENYKSHPAIKAPLSN